MNVASWGHAKVSTAAHYKTTITRHRGVTDHHGHARIAYRISDATVRYRVVVDVHVTKAGHSANCRTGFTPVRS